MPALTCTAKWLWHRSPPAPVPNATLTRRTIHALGSQRCLVFMNFQQRLKDTAAKLAARRMPVAALHGELSKQQRKATLEAFRRGERRRRWPALFFAATLPVHSTAPLPRAEHAASCPARTAGMPCLPTFTRLRLPYLHPTPTPSFAGDFRALLVSDVAARGLDVPEVDAVFHLELPTGALHAACSSLILCLSALRVLGGARLPAALPSVRALLLVLGLS